MEIKYTYEGKIKPLMINSVFINLVALGSVYFSIERLFDEDWVVVLIYIFGSVIGKWFAMIHFENYRNKFYNIFQKGKVTQEAEEDGLLNR